MAAPTPTHRIRPTGKKLENGYRCLIVNSLNPSIDLMEKSVQPVGKDTDAPVPTSDMFNNKYETFAPRPLMKGTPAQAICNYAPGALTALDAIMGKRATITEWYPNGDSYCYYGFYQKYERNHHTNGTQPEITLTIFPTFEDPITHQEQDPVFTPFVGTGDPFSWL